MATFIFVVILAYFWLRSRAVQNSSMNQDWATDLGILIRMAFKVACAQFAPKKCDVHANLDQIAEIARQASAEGADLVLYPETATTAYYLEGGVLEAATTAEAIHIGLAERLKNLNRPIDICLGFYELAQREVRNSCVYLELGTENPGIRKVYRKFFLPTYGIFDEERFVSRGHDLGDFDSRFGRMAILICEDVWHSILSTLCALRGAEVLLIPSASPSRGFSQGRVPDNIHRYERMLRNLCEEHGVFAVNTHLVGFEGGKGFSGGSMVVDPHGQKLVQAPAFEEHLAFAEIDLEKVTQARAQTPLISDLRSTWEDLRRIIHNLN